MTNANQTYPNGANAKFPRRLGRTPYRVTLKFTSDQWEWLCALGRLESTSVYNVLKHRIFNGTPLEDHSHHAASEVNK